jgi:hypothetical protein
MLFGYSLEIDEYVEANRLQPADCHLLKLCCPVCLKPVGLIEVDGHDSLTHIQGFLDDPAFRCDDRLSDFTLEYREQQNMHARNKRTEIVHRDLLIALLGKDPIAQYEDDVAVILGKLRSKGAMRWLAQWHLEMAVDIRRSTPNDEIEFRTDGEDYLAKLSAAHKIEVPSSGYARQVHFQIGHQLMQYLLSRERTADDDYDWLFIHALKLCLSRWTTEARLDGNESVECPCDLDTVAREKIAASRIVVGCFCDFLLEDREAHMKAMETLAGFEIKPPLSPIPMPLIGFIGIEILATMKTTLFRLPYLSMLAESDRPCRPAA